MTDPGRRPYLAVVKPGHVALFERLANHPGIATLVETIWDRRRGERRRPAGPRPVERRHGERRRSADDDWTHGFLLVNRRLQVA